MLRVMVKRDKIVLKLGSIEENPDGTMTVVCAGYQNKKPLPLDLSHVRVRKGSALIFRQSQSSDLDDYQLTIVLFPGRIIGGSRPGETDRQSEPASCRTLEPLQFFAVS